MRSSKYAENVWVPDAPIHTGIGECLFFVGQIIVMIGFATFTQYDLYVLPNEVMTAAQVNEHYLRFYPMIQDIFVFGLVGLTLTRASVKSNSYSVFVFGSIIYIWAFQWTILDYGFWGQVTNKTYRIKRININLESILDGHKGGIAALVSFGCFYGRSNLTQQMILIAWEIFFYSLNKSVLIKQLCIQDVGGVIPEYLFAAAFGISAATYLQPIRAKTDAGPKKDEDITS
jgi:hypothetical protein